jgi:heat shock protein beta-11
MDLAKEENGGAVAMATSTDSAHPPQSVNDGSEQTFWSTTGLFPQELVLELSEMTPISTLRLVGTNRVLSFQ